MSSDEREREEWSTFWSVVRVSFYRSFLVLVLTVEPGTGSTYVVCVSIQHLKNITSEPHTKYCNHHNDEECIMNVYSVGITNHEGGRSSSR